MPCDPAALHLHTLYLIDARGGLTGINQWDGGAVPRFHLVRSETGNRWRFRADLEPELVRSLESLCEAEPVGGDLRADPRLAGRALDLLNRASPVQAVWRGPAYTFPPEVPAPEAAPTVTVTEANAHVLSRWLPDWRPDVPHRQPFLAVLQDGAAVSVCASVRITPAAHQAGVETHPDFRRRGLASDVVRAWAEAVRGHGAEPIYSTSWENAASQAVARMLGLSLAATDFHVR
ncbi:MAG: GNAT family N-acetyltransferase [Pseudomonadales bacterium]